MNDGHGEHKGLVQVDLEQSRVDARLLRSSMFYKNSTNSVSRTAGERLLWDSSSTTNHYSINTPLLARRIGVSCSLQASWERLLSTQGYIIATHVTGCRLDSDSGFTQFCHGRARIDPPLCTILARKMSSDVLFTFIDSQNRPYKIKRANKSGRHQATQITSEAFRR